MSNVIPSPNMSLPIPIVGVETGPLYASDLNNSLLIVDAHNHSAGSGVQINPAGLNINTDLTFSGNNATNLRSIRLTPSTVADPSDIGCVFENNVGDLWYNNSIGQQVQITSGNAVAVSGAIGFSGLPSGTASAAYIAGSGTFQFQQATSVGANLDVASVAIRYPGSYPTPAGNFIQLQAPNTLASGYSITLPSLPAANNTFMTMSTAGVIGTLLTVDNSTIAISGNSLVIKTGGITSGLLSSNLNLPGNVVQAAGRNLLVSNTNAAADLSMLRASFQGGGGGRITGEGATYVRNSAGNYTISITTPFSDTPSIFVSVNASGNYSSIINQINPTTYQVLVFDANTSSSDDRDFSILLIGQR